MSYLDELKQKAEITRLKEQEQQQQQQAKQAKFNQLARPSLEKLYQYIREFVLHMETIKPNIHVVFSLAGLFNNVQFKQHEYVLDRLNESTQYFSLRIFNRCKHKVRIESQSYADLQKKIDILNRSNISYDYQQVNNKREQFTHGLIELKGDIIAEFKFFINHESWAIGINIRNFTDINQRFYHLHPEDIDEKFLDDLAHYINRDSDDDFISHHQISPLALNKELTQQQRIRQKVVKNVVKRKQSVLEKQREAAKALQEARETTPSQPPKKKSWLLGLFSRD